MMDDPLFPTLTPARYCKGKVTAHCPSDGTDYKTRAMRLAEALGGRLVGRAGGYNMSPRRGAELLAKHAAGWDATYSGTLSPPEAP